MAQTNNCDVSKGNGIVATCSKMAKLDFFISYIFYVFLHCLSHKILDFKIQML